MQKYTSRPVTIEATQWDGTAEDATRIINWILENGGTARYDDAFVVREESGPEEGVEYTIEVLNIDTLEGTMRASIYDYIIKGTQGEFYPCKPDIFVNKYKREEEQ